MIINTITINPPLLEVMVFWTIVALYSCEKYNHNLHSFLELMQCREQITGHQFIVPPSVHHF